MSDNAYTQVKFRQLLAFFTPLGFSAMLVTISHVIINGTLAHSPHPEMIIASYALPMSIMFVTEKPALLLRQTCSVLVRDHVSFRAMVMLTIYVLGSVFLVDALIGLTSMGPFIFKNVFGTTSDMIQPMLDVYRILMFVTVFSGIRCVFHGIIIFNLRTKWLTIGMVIRLIGMCSLSFYFIKTESVTSGTVGAIIFLSGMMIEAAVCFWEGRGLLKNVIPQKLPGHPIQRTRQIYAFYSPLLYSSCIAVIAFPAINAFLGKTAGVHLSIAAFAIAGGLAELIVSFFTYIHQIVINFYRKDAAAVKRFVMTLSLIPALLTGIFCYSPIGPWFMGTIMGLNQQLMEESLDTLRVFMIMTLFFPWLDYCHGLLMLHDQTKVFIWSQLGNACIVLLTLIICIFLFPGFNGMLGAFAQSLGVVAETIILLLSLRALAKDEARRFPWLCPIGNPNETVGK